MKVCLQRLNEGLVVLPLSGRSVSSLLFRIASCGAWNRPTIVRRFCKPIEVVLVVTDHLPQHVFDRSIVSFYYAIAFRVIRFCACSLDAQDIAHCLKNFALELSSLVRMEVLYYPKPGNPFINAVYEESLCSLDLKSKTDFNSFTSVGKEFKFCAM